MVKALSQDRNRTRFVEDVVGDDVVAVVDDGVMALENDAE
jgi:hypothetical protein